MLKRFSEWSSFMCKTYGAIFLATRQTFDIVQFSKNDVQVCSMSNLVNLVKALLDLIFDFRSFEAKNRVFEFDRQQMNTFEFFQCSISDVQVRLMFYEMVFTTSLEISKLQNSTVIYFQYFFTSNCQSFDESM